MFIVIACFGLTGVLIWDLVKMPLLVLTFIIFFLGRLFRFKNRLLLLSWSIEELMLPVGSWEEVKSCSSSCWLWILGF